MANLKLIFDLCEQNNINLEKLSEDASVDFFDMMELINTGDGKISDMENIAAALNINPVVFYLKQHPPGK